MKENKVNLFVVGAMKAGTTSFAELLSKHTQIYCPPVKEPNYFINRLPKQLYEPGRVFNLDDYLKNEFPEPLHITKTESELQYRKIFSLASTEKYRVDTSTVYLHAKESAKLIHSYNPDAKIMVLLRDPMRRTFSHYKMDFGKGRVNDTFETLITKDIAAYQNQSLPWYSYLAMSLYNKSIDRFKEQFSEVLVINFENFINNEKDTMATISSFLEIDSFENMTMDHQNVARRPLFPKLFYLLKRLGLKDYFSKIFSSTFKQWLFRITSSKEKFEIDLSEATRENLKQIFSTESQI
ncbi:MAG: sulfotransferase [Bacteroidetes bacterium]|nr:sulfotransferase [Bacteroidota bacterium]